MKLSLCIFKIYLTILKFEIFLFMGSIDFWVSFPVHTRGRFNVVRHRTTSYRRWNDVLCLRGLCPDRDFSSVQFKYLDRSSHPEVFLVKGVLKIWSRFTGEQPWSVISIKLLRNFIEITFRQSHFGMGVLL